MSSLEHVRSLVAGIPVLEPEVDDLDDCADDGFDAAWELMLAARAELQQAA
jgi:hypothetical protein